MLVPPAVRELLGELGIPIAGEIEVWEVPGEKMPHVYGGWYLIAGRLVSRPPSEYREFALGSWQLYFSTGESFKVAAFEGMEVCELNFLADVDNFIEPEESVS
jgi:hypothetical protein